MQLATKILVVAEQCRQSEVADSDRIRIAYIEAASPVRTESGEASARNQSETTDEHLPEQGFLDRASPT